MKVIIMGERMVSMSGYIIHDTYEGFLVRSKKSHSETKMMNRNQSKIHVHPRINTYHA